MLHYKKIIDQISNVGVHEELDLYAQLKQRAFNRVVAIILLALLVMLISDLVGKNETLYLTIIAVFMTLFHFVFQYYKFHILSTIYFAAVYPSLLLVLTVFYGEAMNINYIYSAFIIIVLLGFEQKWPRIIFSAYIFCLQAAGIYYNRFYGSIIEKDIPLLDGILILILPIVGVSILVLDQVSTIKNLYEEQKEYNKSLTIKNKALQNLNGINESKNNLLAVVAHDLKDPALAFHNLTRKIAYLIKQEEPERIEKLAYDFEVAGTKLYYIISNLLNWVTTQQGNIVTQKQVFVLETLLDEVIDSLKLQSQDKSIKVIYDLTQVQKLTTDRDILRVILFNLINNAIKYSYKNGVVLIKSLQDGPTSNVIQVIDSGTGMDADLIGKMMNKGEIISKSGTLQERGYGIGLKICQALIQHLEGKIKIESEVGKGSIFNVVLPA